MYLYTLLRTNATTSEAIDAAPFIDSTSLWTLTAILESSALVSIAVFVRNINQSHIHTFFSTATGPQFAADSFQTATTDEIRFDIFTYRKSYYASIRPELRAWLAGNWKRWTVDEKPEWFTPKLLARIPEDLIPASATQETRECRISAIKERRKSLVGGAIGGGLVGPALS